MELNSIENLITQKYTGLIAQFTAQNLRVTLTQDSSTTFRLLSTELALYFGIESVEEFVNRLFEKIKSAHYVHQHVPFGGFFYKQQTDELICGPDAIIITFRRFITTCSSEFLEIIFNKYLITPAYS